jgi:hypothetical protein
MRIRRAVAVGLMVALTVPASAGIRTRCKPLLGGHSAAAHARTKGHRRLCEISGSGSVEVSKTGGLGQIDIHDKYAAVVQRDDGVVAIVDLWGMDVVGRYEDTVDQALDGDVAFSDDGEWVFFARQTSNFDEDGVHVLDVSDKTAPTLTQYHPAGGAFRIEYYRDDAGEWVILLDAIDGLVVYRFVRETGTIVKVFQDAMPALKVGGPASAGIDVEKDRMTGMPLLYVTTGATGVQVYDFANPVMPEIVGEWSDVGLADIEVKSTKKTRKIFAATEYWFDKTIPPKVVVLDATDLGAIEQVSTRSFGLPADDLWRIQGMHLRHDGDLYIAHSHAGLIRMDGRRVTGVASLPAAHNEEAGYNAAPYAMDVVGDGSMIYLTDASSGRLWQLYPLLSFPVVRGG